MKYKINIKSQAVIVMLLITTIVGTSIKASVSENNDNQKYTSLKYKLLNTIKDFKVSDVQYLIQQDNICLRMNYTAGANKDIFISFSNKNKVQSILVPPDSTIKKGSSSSEFDIPASNLNGTTNVNVYITDNSTKKMFEEVMNGKQYSGMSISLDSKIISHAKSIFQTQYNNIEANQVIFNVNNAKNGFEILKAGIADNQNSEELMLKYKSKKNGCLVVTGGTVQQHFNYINNISSGDNNMFSLTLPEKSISQSDNLGIIELDSINSNENPYQTQIGLRASKADEESIKYDNTSVKGKFLITKHPLAFDFSRGKLSSLPVYDNKSGDPFPVDLRSTDISGLKLGNDRLNDLLHADFDSKTKFPAHLPDGYNPAAIMEIGKNPGLGLNALHKKGITGKGVGIAIIDQNLLVDHEEYKDRLKCYEEMHWPSDQKQASMHGSAVASIAVGKNVGVAPGADLYYIAVQNGTDVKGNFYYDFKPLAKAIDRVLEINASLPKDRKIRVISISVSWNPLKSGYKEITEAVKKAEKQGVFVISTTLPLTSSFNFIGLGRKPMSDPDKTESYTGGLFWRNDIGKVKRINENEILVPMDAITTASATGNNDYVHYDDGGLSWTVPYVSGLYALTCQVNPKVTPEIFWQSALKTGNTLIVNKDNKKYNVGKIVNPQKLLNAVAQHK